MPSIREYIRSHGPLRRAVMKLNNALKSSGQSDETKILRNLANNNNFPKTFVEFGFDPHEFNCISLISDHAGLLIDGDPRKVEDAKKILPHTIDVRSMFLDIENIDFIRNKFNALGILSIDVDGNDFYFLRALISISPSIIVVEYNASFGLRPITVPYDPTFDRMAKHPSGWYHGASITALNTLATAHGYGITAISRAGGNVFFTRDGTISPEDAYKESELRNKWSKTTAEEQWRVIENMPYEQIGNSY